MVLYENRRDNFHRARHERKRKRGVFFRKITGKEEIDVYIAGSRL